MSGERAEQVVLVCLWIVGFLLYIEQTRGGDR